MVRVSTSTSTQNWVNPTLHHLSLVLQFTRGKLKKEKVTPTEPAGKIPMDETLENVNSRWVIQPNNSPEWSSGLN